jgi:hypothetical protein
VAFLGSTFTPLPKLFFEYIPDGALEDHSNISADEGMQVLPYHKTIQGIDRTSTKDWVYLNEIVASVRYTGHQFRLSENETRT